MLALSLLSAFEVLRQQRNLSAQSIEICERHIHEDDLLFRLRRTLWLGAIAGRDFLLDAHADRDATFQAELAKLKQNSAALLDGFAATDASPNSVARLRSNVDEFWRGVERIPLVARHLDPNARYDFVQHDLVLRRNALSDALLDFTRDGQKAFETSEVRFDNARRRTERRLFLTLGLSLALGVLVGGLSLLHSGTLERQAALQYEKVAAARAGLQRLSARLIEVQEQERTRLSRNLHDRIGQTLATLRLEISRAESVPARHLPEMRRRLEEARTLAEEAIQEVRSISLLLRPLLLDDLGLGPALQWLAEDFRRRTGILCQITEHQLPDVLPDAVRTCVYRVIQEALHNCEKHSAALWVGISLQRTPGRLIVTVEDNGNGFDPATIAGHPGSLGILGMRERAAVLGGELEVHSAPGKGATLVLRLPLPAAEPSLTPVNKEAAV